MSTDDEATNLFYAACNELTAADRSYSQGVTVDGDTHTDRAVRLLRKAVERRTGLDASNFAMFADGASC